MPRTKPPKTKSVQKRKPPEREVAFGKSFPLSKDSIFLSLTSGQQSFVYHMYLKPVTKWSNAKCYAESYNYEKPTRSHSVEASRLLKDPRIEHCIGVLKAKFVKNLEITRGRILEEEAAIAYSDIGDFFDEEGNLTVNPSKLPAEVRRSIAGFEVIQEKDRTTDQVIATKYKFKLWNKGQSLSRLQDIKGMKAPQKHLVGQDPDNPFPDSNQSQEMLLNLLLQMASRLPKSEKCSVAQGGGANTAEPRLISYDYEAEESRGYVELDDHMGLLLGCSYNDEIDALTLFFCDGKVVEYVDFPERIFDQFIDAKSPSQFFTRRIDGQFAFSILKGKA